VVNLLNTILDVEEKIHDWLTAGVTFVWLINPRRKTVTVFSEPLKFNIFYIDDELNGSPVISGFKCKVSEIFI